MDAIVSAINTLDAMVWGPPMILLLLGTHIYMTVRTGFIQRKLPTAIKLSITKDPDAEGDISQFGALTTALSATIGTGNIVGVATAIMAVRVPYCGCGLRACSALPRNIPRSMRRSSTV